MSFCVTERNLVAKVNCAPRA
uniref:Uncharacterized protein n=1 Tax=Lepeophtheirus salmonis TaxID=72036 RepID=A0A0K2U3Q7_LEPSM